MKDDYPRDWVGYGREIPVVEWPNKARIAISFVLNYEEGSERNILDGDAESESYLTDIPNLTSLKGERHYSAESIFSYGSRVGCWRLLHLFEKYKIPITLFATGLALERNPHFCDFLKNTQHEVAGHGYRWRDYRLVDINTEKKDIIKTLEIIKSRIGRDAVGWYTGRKSSHTQRLIVEEGLLYDSDDYSDDLPFWITINKSTRHLVIPYTLDCNDCRYVTTPGWSTPDDFFLYLKATFDCLYEEGESHPKIMNIGLHSRLSGRAGRSMAIKKFIEYVNGHDKVWFCRRQDIAEYWHTVDRL